MSDYKEAVIAALAAMGLKVEPSGVLGEGHFVIAGVGMGCSLTIGKGERITHVSGHSTRYQSVWRSRRLSGDPKKDAAIIAERHAIAAKTRAADIESRRAEAARERLRDELEDAFAGDGRGVDMRADGALFRFLVRNPTREKAVALRAAIAAIVGNESGSQAPSD